jgi:hypothetical protein
MTRARQRRPSKQQLQVFVRYPVFLSYVCACVPVYSFLNHLRTLDERWSIGLKLFFESRNEIARFFGLSLVRDYLSTRATIAQLHQPQHVAVRQQIREGVMKWTNEVVAYQHSIPQYITNNVVTIITQLIKIDYPEIWPTAFEELLAIGRQNAIGIDIVVRVVCEIEVEIVVYDDRRTRDEVNHNTIIKDAMRAGPVIGDIVVFLCDSIAKQASAAAAAAASSTSGSANTQQWPSAFLQAAMSPQSSTNVQISSPSSSSSSKSAIQLADRCLRCLAELIGWIDVTFAIHDYTLSVLYGCLKSSTPNRLLRFGACACLCELVKKGMDAYGKMRVIKQINLIPMLLSVSTELITPKRRSASILEGGGQLYATKSDEIDEDNDDDDDDEDTEKDYGELVDSLFEELLGCWITFEDNACKEGFIPNGTVPLSVGTDIALMLEQTWTLVLHVFGARLTSVATTVLQSLNRYTNLLKQQCLHEARTNEGIANVPGYFVAVNVIKQLLVAIYRQMQYAPDFEFDLGDEDDAEEVEVSVCVCLCVRVCVCMYVCVCSFAFKFATRSGFTPSDIVPA